MLKIKGFSAVLCLILIINLLSAIPVSAASISPPSGIVGTTVTIVGLTSPNTYLILWDSVSYGNGNVPSGGSITFTIPETVGGTHTIVVESPIGTSALTPTSFIVLPSISISPESGAAGTSLSISGKGFFPSEASILITYDGTSVKTDITANSNGSWSSTITAPNSAGGSHTLDSSGASTVATNVENKTFTIKPAITVSPVSGSVGTLITVTGSGFVASETGIKVIYDSKDTKTGLTADSSGSWSTTFNAPASSSGSHVIDAYGATTTAANVADGSFSVAPGISIDKTQAVVGDTITVTGSGFGQYESNIYVTFDGLDKSSKITADENGQWSTTMQVPPSVSGSHAIDAHGGVIAASSVVDKIITILATITLNPAGGNVGDTITISGSGFTGGKSVAITFGTVPALSDVSVDINGTFSTTFKAPKGKSGSLKVTATDSNSVSATANFAVETTPPAVPKITSPAQGDTVGFIGDARADFKWTEVTDPSGVSYDIQVASEPTFKAMVFEYSGLPSALYKSLEKEVLPQGEYYWRVRAIDGAGNASEWTAPTKFQAGMMSTTTFIIIIVVVIVIILIFLRARAVFKRR